MGFILSSNEEVAMDFRCREIVQTPIAFVEAEPAATNIIGLILLTASKICCIDPCLLPSITVICGAQSAVLDIGLWPLCQ